MDSNSAAIGIVALIIGEIIVLVALSFGIVKADGKHLESKLLINLDESVFVNNFWKKSAPFRLLLWAILVGLSYLFFGVAGFVAPIVLFLARPFYAPRILNSCLKRDSQQEWAKLYPKRYELLLEHPMTALHIATFNSNNPSDVRELQIVQSAKSLPSVEQIHKKILLNTDTDKKHSDNRMNRKAGKKTNGKN